MSKTYKMLIEETDPYIVRARRLEDEKGERYTLLTGVITIDGSKKNPSFPGIFEIEEIRCLLDTDRRVRV